MTVQWRRGIFRLWLVLSLLWVVWGIGLTISLIPVFPRSSLIAREYESCLEFKEGLVRRPNTRPTREWSDAETYNYYAAIDAVGRECREVFTNKTAALPGEQRLAAFSLLGYILLPPLVVWFLGVTLVWILGWIFDGFKPRRKTLGIDKSSPHPEKPNVVQA